jgi:hypothetical protein
MHRYKFGLLVGLIITTLYLPFAMIYYLNEGNSLSERPIFAALYLYIILGHAILYAIGLIFHWSGYGLKKPGLVGFGTIFILIAGVVLFPSLLVILPLSILLMILNQKEKVKL